MKYAIGVDLGGTAIKAGLVSETGEITHRIEVPTEARSGGAGIGRQIAEVARRIHAESGRDDAIVGIGVGSPGVIVAETGVIQYSPNLYDEEGNQWHDVPLVQHIENELGDLKGLAVVLENDVNAMTFGEFTFGAGRDVRHMVGMTLGTGVGGGVVIDGRVHRGPSNSAGEIGHMTVVPDGRLCGCGNHGCLEAHVGTRGLLERTREKIVAEGRPSLLERDLKELTPRRISEAADAGDAVAREIFEETGRFIGIVLASIANLLNPEMAVIGGGISAASDAILYEPIRREVRLRALEVPANAMRIVRAELGNDAGMVGAASLAIQAAESGGRS